ncbi:single-stranded DNA-binding protein [Corynebacterium propinquum]|uniref:single-stranded DNA-binding protein n=1 Tax=Corynebacterium propinquum TaxID=43769 RepID=UPI00223BFBCB|nr:single-stranded DNA-binding protein [Corynebacterium propinquum]MCT1819395.1 single-stranded DNA-binding protein [Corynebacterium propinquum]
MSLSQITVVGNLVADPELRFTQSGAAVANFRIASTPRRYNSQTQQWEDGEALFLGCTAWNQLAQNVAQSLAKGMQVIVTGKLKQRSYQNKQGEDRISFEVDLDAVGPSLAWATAQVTRNQKGQQGQSQNQGQQNSNWNPQPNDPWNSQPAGGFSNNNGNPPF